jgi:hypothetical protein
MNKPQHITDEMLFAYVDNELDATSRAHVEAAMAADPALAERMERQRSLRTLLGEAYAPTLEEPIPKRLLEAVEAPPPKARVLDLVAARKSRERVDTAAPAAANDWSWKHWGGMAACLVVGVLVGHSAWIGNATTDILSQGGQLVAGAELGQALSTQLASRQAADAPVRIGVSYLSSDNEFCRSFVVTRTGTGGLACRHDGNWELRVVAKDKPVTGGSGNLRMASSPVPPAVLKSMEGHIKGAPLDADAEREAMNRGWRPQ